MYTTIRTLVGKQTSAIICIHRFLINIETTTEP
jgi:hypothetical protein